MSDADDPKRILSDVDTVYANYLLTCRRLGIEPVPRDRAGLLVAAWLGRIESAMCREQGPHTKH
jgi:hypothetical protein